MYSPVARSVCELTRMIAGVDTVQLVHRQPVSRVMRYFAVAPLFAIPVPDLMLRIFLLGPYANPRLVKSMGYVLRSLPPSAVVHRVGG